MLKSKETYYYSNYNIALYSTVAIVFVFLSIYLQGYNYTTYQIGLLLGMTYLGSLVTPLLFVKFLKADETTTKYMSYFMGLSLIAIPFIVQNYYLLLLDLLLFGITRAVIQTYLDATTIRIFKEKYGIIRGMGSFGFLLIATVIGMNYTSNIVEYSMYLIASGLIIFGYFIKMENTTDNQMFDFKILTENKLLWFFIFLFHLPLGILFSFLSIFLIENGVQVDNISVVWNISILAEIVGFMTIIFFKDMLSVNKFIVLSIIVTIGRLCLINAYPQTLPVLLFGQSLHIFTYAVFHMNLIKLLEEKFKNNMKMAMKLYGSIGYGLSMCVGAVLGGYIYSQNIFYISALIMVGALITYIIYIKKTRTI